MEYDVILQKMMPVYMEVTVTVKDTHSVAEALQAAIDTVDGTPFPRHVLQRPKPGMWSFQYPLDAADFITSIEHKPEIIAMLTEDGPILGPRINAERLRFAVRQMEQTGCDSVEIRQASRQLLDALDRL